MKKLIQNIKTLIQVRERNVDRVSGADMKVLPTLNDAYLEIEDGRIIGYGEMTDLPESTYDEVIDASGRMVLPAWCDSHTHIVYAGDRSGEFEDRISGMTYEEIAAKGGGILNSAKRLQATDEDDLYAQSISRLEQVMKMGTGAIEIKSGYGLTVDAELKMLRIIRRMKENFDIPIKATLLAAHALPAEYKADRKAYIDLIINELIPKVADEGLADYIDVFCEKNYFTTEDTAIILETGAKYGMLPKIHVNQFNAIGGVQVGVEYSALSVDHLEVMRQEDIEILKGKTTIPVALPGCSYFLGIPYTPARDIIDAGLPLALASDYNPGSAPSGNMNFVVSAACVKMRMTPQESINAATINGAAAMGLSEEVGSITIGKQANFIITKPIPSIASLPYQFGNMLVDRMFINGKEIN